VPAVASRSRLKSGLTWLTTVRRSRAIACAQDNELQPHSSGRGLNVIQLKLRSRRSWIDENSDDFGIGLTF